MIEITPDKIEMEFTPDEVKLLLMCVSAAECVRHEKEITAMKEKLTKNFHEWYRARAEWLIRTMMGDSCIKLRSVQFRTREQENT